MCEMMEKLQAEGRAEGLNEMAIKMLRYNEPIEKIMDYTSLTAEQINALAQQIH